MMRRGAWYFGGCRLGYMEAGSGGEHPSLYIAWHAVKAACRVKLKGVGVVNIVDKTRQAIARIDRARVTRRERLDRVFEKAETLRAARQEWLHRFLSERRRLRREAAALWRSHRGA